MVMYIRMRVRQPQVLRMLHPIRIYRLPAGLHHFLPYVPGGRCKLSIA